MFFTEDTQSAHGTPWQYHASEETRQGWCNSSTHPQNTSNKGVLLTCGSDEEYPLHDPPPGLDEDQPPVQSLQGNLDGGLPANEGNDLSLDSLLDWSQPAFMPTLTYSGSEDTFGSGRTWDVHATSAYADYEHRNSVPTTDSLHNTFADYPPALEDTSGIGGTQIPGAPEHSADRIAVAPGGHTVHGVPNVGRRTLPRQRSRYSLSSKFETAPVPIPQSSNSEYGLDPMQRWRQSPPENEAASFSAIFNAIQDKNVRHSPFETRQSATPSIRSGYSSSSASVASTRSSTSAFFGHRSARRVRKTQQTTTERRNERNRRLWMCTFCCDTFQRKHDWTRHEKALHLNLEQWCCAPFGGVVLREETQQSHCAYCGALDPSPEHLKLHSHSGCRKGIDSTDVRTYQRKDHLIQHLRGFHQLDELPDVEQWKVSGPIITSRCGFCDERLPSWEVRASHLTAHFRSGKTMGDWTGDHEFEPSVAGQVRNAFPPYVLAAEASSQVPFSATNPSLYLDQVSQIVQRLQERLNPGPAESDQCGPPGSSTTLHNHPPDQDFEVTLTSYTEYLGWYLGQFAQKSILDGVFPTDKMFQDELRLLMYGCNDEWERTIADSPEWLARVRQQYIGGGQDGSSQNR